MIGNQKNLWFVLVLAVFAVCCKNRSPTKATPPKTNIDNKKIIEDIDLEVFKNITSNQNPKISTLIERRNELQKSMDVKEYCYWNFQLYDTLEKYEKVSFFTEDANDLVRTALLQGDTILTKKANIFLYNMAMYFNRESDYHAAQKLFEQFQSFDASQKKLDPLKSAFIKGALADIYLRLGDNKKSMLLLKEVYDYFSHLPLDQRQPIVYVAIGNACNEMGDYQTAIYYAGEGLSLPNLQPKYIGYLKSVWAESLIESHRFLEAEIKAAEVIKLFNNNEDISDDDRYKFLQIYAATLTGAGKYRQAIEQYNLAIGFGFRAVGSDKTREFSKLYKSLGDCFNRLQQKDSALYYYHKALGCVVKINNSNTSSLPTAKELYAENAIQEALDALAGYWIQSGSTSATKQALEALQLAMKVDELLQQQFSFDASKLDYQLQKKKRSSQAIQLCLQLYHNDNDQQWVQKGWAFSEAAKAALLRDDIRQQIVYGQNTNDSLIQQINWNQQETAELKRQLFETTDTGITKALTEKMNELDKNYADLTMQSKVKNPAIEKLLLKEEDVDFLKSELFNDIPLVEYFSADNGRYYIFSKDVLGKINMDTCTLPDSTVTKWLSFFANAEGCNNNPDGFKQQANYIYKVILKSFFKDKQPPNLLIIPDGKLWYLPWDALVTDPTLKTSWKQTQFLVKSTSVTLGFSLQNLIQQKERRPLPTTIELAAFAPAFMHKERGQASLVSSLKELERIKETQPEGKYFTNKSATVANFRLMASNAQILHLSTHASSGENESQCKLQLYDSALYLHELYPLNVNATTVVLSACETGLGKFENGEGVFSMARGFYFAGAKNVITSLWKVDDESTAALFQLFYVQKDEPFQMLHRAKLDYLEQHAGSAGSPYYWAAFINTGYEKYENTSFVKWWMWLALGLALAVGVIYLWRSKKKN